jgi:hypothetical protein
MPSAAGTTSAADSGSVTAFSTPEPRCAAVSVTAPIMKTTPRTRTISAFSARIASR